MVYSRSKSNNFYNKFPKKQQAKYKLRAMLKDKGYLAFIDNKLGNKITLDIKMVDPKVVILLDVPYPFHNGYYIRQREIIESYGYKVIYLTSDRVLNSKGLYSYNYLFQQLYRLEKQKMHIDNI